MEDILDSLMGIIAILSCIALPICLGMYISVRAINTRHRERLELIRQGIVPPNDKIKPAPNRYRSLRNGFLCIGIALGIIVGYVLANNLDLEDENGNFAILASILFFLGLAYTTFFFVTRNKKDLDNEIE